MVLFTGPSFTFTYRVLDAEVFMIASELNVFMSLTAASDASSVFMKQDDNEIRMVM